MQNYQFIVIIMLSVQENPRGSLMTPAVVRAYERPRPTRVATRAYESLKNVLANLAVVFQNLQAQQNFHWPWPVVRGLS